MLNTMRDIDSCLVLASDPSEDPVTEVPYQDEMDRRIEGKCYATTERAQRRNYPYDLRRPTLSRIRMEYMSFNGTVIMILRVVAPQTPKTIDGF